MNLHLRELRIIGVDHCHAVFVRSPDGAKLETEFHIESNGASPEPDIFFHGFVGTAAELREIMSAVKAFCTAAGDWDLPNQPPLV